MFRETPYMSQLWRHHPQGGRCTPRVQPVRVMRRSQSCGSPVTPGPRRCRSAASVSTLGGVCRAVFCGGCEHLVRSLPGVWWLRLRHLHVGPVLLLSLA